jgi:hypothetical protein
MRCIINNKHILLIIVVTFISRLIYHTNAPFFEDEGLFLLDTSKNFLDLYENTLYMKPFFGAYYYHVIFKFFGEFSFLALHTSTTIFIIFSNIFLYLIAKEYTKNTAISLITPLLFLAFTHLSIGGYAHSSLEHFQLPILLAGYYYIFIKPISGIGLVLLSFAIMVKQNVALVVLSLFKHIINHWKLSLIVGILWFLTIVILFSNFFFNNLIFPFEYYNISVYLKWDNFFNYFLTSGFGFNALLLISAIFSVFLFYKQKKREFIFILLLSISLLATPMYPQHFVIITPFIIIVSIVGLNYIVNKFPNLLFIVKGGVTMLLILMLLKIYVNTYKTFDNNYLTTNQTIYGRLDGNTIGVSKLLEFLPTIKNKKVYIYPILFPHPYITYNFSTIEKYYSNDHIDIILKHSFLRNKLLNSIKESKPDYLIKMKSSDLDMYIQEDINKNYVLLHEFGPIRVFKIK